MCYRSCCSPLPCSLDIPMRTACRACMHRLHACEGCMRARIACVRGLLDYADCIHAAIAYMHACARYIQAHARSMHACACCPRTHMCMRMRMCLDVFLTCLRVLVQCMHLCAYITLAPRLDIALASLSQPGKQRYKDMCTCMHEIVKMNVCSRGECMELA